MPFKNYDQLVEQVNAGQGVTTCFMYELRDAHGAGKLGVNVVMNISEELDRRGLSHFPLELAQNQWEKARIYKRGTPVGDVIHSAINFADNSDDVLRNIAGNTGNDIIKRIRELVCD